MRRYARQMKRAGPEQELKAQLAGELCSILHGWQRDAGAAWVDMHTSDLRRFSLTRIIRYIARAGYELEVHLKKTQRRENRPKPRQPTSTVVRYDYNGVPERESLPQRHE
jgi:hypothetical protein